MVFAVFIVYNVQYQRSQRPGENIRIIGIEISKGGKRVDKEGS